MIIVADVNEQSTNPAIIRLMKQHFGEGQVVVGSLLFGDYSIPLNTGLLSIERKEPSDLLASIADGRLFRQVHEMVNNSRWPLVIVHGSLYYDVDDMLMVDGVRMGWRGASVRAALRAVQWAGCPVEFCPTGQFPMAVHEAINTAGKPDHAHYQVTKTKKPPIDFYPEQTDHRQRIEFLAGIPGIGIKRAKSLLEYVGGRLIDAMEWISLTYTSPSDAMPELWGKQTVDMTRQFLGLSAKEYILVKEESDEKENDSQDGSSAGDSSPSRASGE